MIKKLSFISPRKPLAILAIILALTMTLGLVAFAASPLYEEEVVYDEVLFENYEKGLTYDEEILSENEEAKEKEQEIIVLSSVDHGHSFITRGELRDVNGVPQTVFGYYDTIMAYFEYRIPDGVTINAGDMMTVAIPPQLVFRATVTFDIFDNDGQKSGTGVVNSATNTITITFTDYYEAKPLGRGGHFYVWIAWNRSKAEVGDTFPIRLPYDGTAGGKNITVGSGVIISPNERLFKWGWVVDNLTTVNWIARVNREMVNIPDAVFRDTLGPGQVLINNVWVEVGHWVNGDWVWLGGFYPYDYGRLTIAPDGTSFEIDLGNLVRGASTAIPGTRPGSAAHQNGVSVIIHYTARITDNGAAAVTTGYRNSAFLEGTCVRTHHITAWTPIVGGGGQPGGFRFDFSAYKEIYGVGSLSKPAIFEFELIDITANPNQVVAWGQVEITDRGISGRQPITFYFDPAFSNPITNWWSVLRNGHEYRLVEVAHPDYDVSYSGVNLISGTNNEFLVSSAVSSATITVVNTERPTEPKDSFDFSAYKKIYGEGSLSNPETFTFELIDIATNQVVAWGRVTITDRGVSGKQPIAFYLDSTFLNPITNWWSVLRNGYEYRLVEVNHPDYDVSYSGINLIPGTDNEFLVSNEVSSVTIYMVNTERSSNGNGNGNDNGNGNGNGNDNGPTDPYDPPRPPGGGGGGWHGVPNIPNIPDPADPTDPTDPVLDLTDPTDPTLDIVDPTDPIIELEEPIVEAPTPVDTTAPQTSDETQLPWLPLILSAAGLLAIVYMVRRRL